MQTIAVNDAKYTPSPGWFRSGSTYLQSNTPGAYLDLQFVSTACWLLVDPSPVSAVTSTAADFPIITYSIDHGAESRYQILSTDTQIQLASGLAAGEHVLRVKFAAISYTLDRWNTPSMVLRVTGFGIDDLGTWLQAPYPTRVVYGACDSNGAGQEALAAGVGTANQDAGQTFWYVLQAGLACRLGHQSFEFQGYTANGSGNVPTAPAIIDKYFSATSRWVSGRYSPAPDAVILVHGINDGANDVTATLQTLIRTIRAAVKPETRIFACVPWRGDHATEIANAVTNAGDALAYSINTGTTSYANNNPHMTAAGHTAYGNDLLALIRPLMPPAKMAPMVSGQPMNAAFAGVGRA
jgi:hypothetical protein